MERSCHDATPQLEFFTGEVNTATLKSITRCKGK
jgi:hypothetical protein